VKTLIQKLTTQIVPSLQVSQDFRKLNAATTKDYFPLPFMNIILDHVFYQECYNFLDGFFKYNQVVIQLANQLKTMFTTEWETFAFNRMPFDLCNALEHSKDC